MFEQPHVADRVQRHAAGQHQPAGAGCAQQMIDDMDHGVLEHQLRRGRLVEAILGVGPVLDVLDAQHRVGIPELIGFQRLAEDVDQRALVGMIERVAVPVGHRAIELDLAIVAEMQHVLSAARNRDWWRGSCRPRRRRPCSGPRWTARSSRPASTRSRCRRRRANRTCCHCSRAGASRRSRRHRARSTPDRRCRRAPRSRPARRRRQTARPQRKTRRGCHGAACRSAARASASPSCRPRIFGVRVIWSRRRPSKPAASVVRSSFRLCGTSSSTERASVPASVG